MATTVKIPYPGIPDPVDDLQPTAAALKESMDTLLGRKDNLHDYSAVQWKDFQEQIDTIDNSLADLVITPATTAQYLADTADKILDTDGVWGAADYVTLTDAATIALDMSTFIQGVVTLAGNRTLGNPSNTKPGQNGCIRIVQDGTGSRTLAYASNWKFAGGTAPVLTTTAGAVDFLFYQVISSTFVYGALVNDVK